MEVTADAKYNAGYIKIIPKVKVAYSLEFDKNYVADFDDKRNLVGIELLEAKSYKPGDLQTLMSKANAAAQKDGGRGDSEPTSKRSA